MKLFLLDLPGKQLLFKKGYYRFYFYFISKKKVLLSSKIDATRINVLKKFLFLLLIKSTQRLRCLLYNFLPMLLFVFKNLFLRRDLFIVFLFIYFHSWKGLGLLEHTIFFIGECLWIASPRAALKRSDSRLLFFYF